MNDTSKKMYTVASRLKEYRNIIKMNQVAFAESIGVASYKLRDCEREKQRFDDDILAKIANQYPSLNLNWLITGNGEMIDVKSKDPLYCQIYEAWKVKEQTKHWDICVLLKYGNEEYLASIKKDLLAMQNITLNRLKIESAVEL